MRNTTYDIVVTFSDRRVRGRFFEKIGFYAPSTKVKFFFINFLRLSLWLNKGAALSPRIGFLIGKLPQGDQVTELAN